MGEPVHNLCIVNIQKTPLHSVCSLPIFSKIDDVMIGVMKELEMEVPTWSLTRYLMLSVSGNAQDDQRRLCVSGCDLDGTPFTLLKSVLLTQNGQKVMRTINNKEQREHEFHYVVAAWDKSEAADEEQKAGDGLHAELSFVGN